MGKGVIEGRAGTFGGREADGLRGRKVLDGSSPNGEATAGRAVGRVVVIVATRGETKGGIATVIGIYERGGLFARWPALYLHSHVDGPNSFDKVIAMLRALGRYLKLLTTGRVALLHVHSASRSSFWRKCSFMIPAFALRCPVIFHLHGAEFDRFYSQECGAVRKLLVRFVLNQAARVVVLASQWKSFVEGIAPSARVVTIFNPVMLPKTRMGEDAKAGAERSRNSLLYLGRFGRRKGIFDLVQAVGLLKASFPDIKLLCGGDGDLEGVARRAQELGLSDQIEIVGWATGATKERLLKEAAVYVLPSYAEGLPMSLLEAMAAGLPAVTTKVGGIPDAVEDGVQGFLVTPGDVDGLAAAIEKLLRDPGLRRTMGIAAQKKVAASFCAESVLFRLESLYGELGRWS